MQYASRPERGHQFGRHFAEGQTIIRRCTLDGGSHFRRHRSLISIDRDDRCLKFLDQPVDSFDTGVQTYCVQVLLQRRTVLDRIQAQNVFDL